MKENEPLHPILVNLLKKRGLSCAQIQSFISSSLKDLPDLTDLLDLKKASKRLVDAYFKGEIIGVFGDYDVDGTSSCALFYHFFSLLDKEIFVFQPDRFVEGYGIHPHSFQKIIEKNVSLLVTVDCGITGHHAAVFAKEKGIDLIITDHHKDAAQSLPEAYAVINPNRKDEKDGPLKSLAGVGVAFALLLQMKNEFKERGKETPSLYCLLPFVALGTICDVAFLNDLNLKLCRHGLKELAKTSYKGLSVFLTDEEKKSKMIFSEKLSFTMGPMINSLGRLEHPEKSLKLLISSDDEEALELHQALTVYNNERKSLQAQVFHEAKGLVIDSIRGRDHKMSIVYKEDWHEGVIGIVASKLVETFGVPAIVFTSSGEEGVIKGSARTAGELSIFDLLKKEENLFIKFGGHKAAAGLSMKKENLPLFRQRIQESLKEIPEILRKEALTYDLEISFDEITPKLVRHLEFLEPFGNGNENPVFLTRNLKIDSFDILKESHVRWNLSSQKNPNAKFKGISFHWIGAWNTPHPTLLFSEQHKNPEGLHAFFRLKINRFNGNEYIQLQILKIDFGLP